MTRFGISDLIDSTGARLLGGDASARVDGLSTDTRCLRPGELYLALSGANFDGNLFAMEALEKGAGALLRRRKGSGPASDSPGVGGEDPQDLAARSGVPVLVHRDPQRALADFAAWHRAHLEIPVIGVTGSCGKTTTKNILAQLLSRELAVVRSPRSFNNHIGVPLTLLLADAQTEALVVEIGTNSPGEIGALCRIARPTGGIVTNVGAAHLAGLGSLEGVAAEKGDLAASVPREGFVVLNADCRFTPLIRANTSARVITFSVEGEGDLNATDLVFHAAGTTFRLEGREITSPLLGTHDVQNLLAALAACRGLGVELERVLPEVMNLAGGRQRMERHELRGLTVLDDSWNANPESARAVIRVLAGLHGHGRRVLVLGDMLELGSFAAELHHAIGVAAARAEIDLFLPVGELAVAAAAGALEGGLDEERVVHVESTEAALERVPALLCDGDVVLVKGSRGMALERLVARLVDERGRDDSAVGPERIRA